ncbi:hypothetical protein M569_00812 [Genlisea aurea]|uniref:Uncharacterized protein n=1 Tax=Genlisea aurea TaxID=192259 RepID=S8D2J8_9LAMI|nr:hypothetical protein M569_00812 [Genlisea aurea]
MAEDKMPNCAVEQGQKSGLSLWKGSRNLIPLRTKVLAEWRGNIEHFFVNARFRPWTATPIFVEI